MDRVELGTQSLMDYRGFADDAGSVQDTEDTNVLVAKLKSERSGQYADRHFHSEDEPR